jgi:hypothetical protein
MVYASCTRLSLRDDAGSFPVENHFAVADAFDVVARGDFIFDHLRVVLVEEHAGGLRKPAVERVEAVAAIGGVAVRDAEGAFGFAHLLAVGDRETIAAPARKIVIPLAVAMRAADPRAAAVGHFDAEHAGLRW